MSARWRSFVAGVLVGAGVVSVVSIVLTGAPLPKYASKVVFENDRVRVKDVTFPPGVMDTGMHTHDLPHVGVILDRGALVFTEPGKAPETVSFSAGSVGYREANVTHQVANPGGKPMRVIEVEVK
jgi:mannose-6-phosphate isomerase-like protein (cupin superfamily)